MKTYSMVYLQEQGWLPLFKKDKDLFEKNNLPPSLPPLLTPEPSGPRTLGAELGAAANEDKAFLFGTHKGEARAGSAAGQARLSRAGP